MNSVLAFHEVSDGQWFDDLIQWLQKHYRLLPAEYLSDLYSGSDVRNGCHITIDDGHRSFQDVIFPVLKRYRVPATLFVSPRICVEQSNFWFQELRLCDESAVRDAAAARMNVPRAALTPFTTTSICKALPLRDVEAILRTCRASGKESRVENVTAEGLKALVDSGLVAVGAHTLSHPILRNESDACSEREIACSVSELSSLINREVIYFAYPNGLPGIDFTEREEAYLAAAGVQLAFSTDSRRVQSSDHRYRVPRIQISYGESLRRIRVKLGWPDTWNVLKKLRRNGEYSERHRLSRLMSTASRGSS